MSKHLTNLTEAGKLLQNVQITHHSLLLLPELQLTLGGIPSIHLPKSEAPPLRAIALSTGGSDLSSAPANWLFYTPQDTRQSSPETLSIPPELTLFGISFIFQYWRHSMEILTSRGRTNCKWKSMRDSIITRRGESELNLRWVCTYLNAVDTWLGVEKRDESQSLRIQGSQWKRIWMIQYKFRKRGAHFILSV